MKDILSIDKPREKIAHRGVESLSDIELMSAIFGSGGRAQSVSALSKRVVETIDSKNGFLSIDDLTAISGIGIAKASQVLAALEFAKRRIEPESRRVTKASDVLPFVSHYSEKKQEHFICLSLNGAHGVIATRVITIGLVNCTQVHPREVFADPIVDRASAVIVCHNHPTGELEPSEADKKVTAELKRAGEVLGIRLLDHLIFSRSGFFSFSERGLL